MCVGRQVFVLVSEMWEDKTKLQQSLLGKQQISTFALTLLYQIDKFGLLLSCGPSQYSYEPQKSTGESKIQPAVDWDTSLVM